MQTKVFKLGDNNGNCDIIMVMMMGAYCLEQYINYDVYKQQQSSFDLKLTSSFSRKSRLRCRVTHSLNSSSKKCKQKSLLTHVQ